MKRINIYTLATLALLLGLAACTQEENMTDPGTTLFDGPYPLQIGTVTVSSEVSDGVQTRVTETSDGTGSVFEENDVITVQLGEETATYTYDGASWTSDTQLYWTAAGQTLTAWYTSPSHTTNAGIDISDQSEGLVYVLRAEASFATTVNLDFTHQLAKVRVVTTGTYDTSESVLKLTAPTELTVRQGEITETGSEGRITMYKTSYEDEDEDNGDITCWEATVPGGTQISSVTIDGTTCELYNTVTTEAGKLHTITLNVAEDPGYTYDQEANTYKVYAANGLLAWNQAASDNPSISCTLAADIDLRGIEYTWLLVGNDLRESNRYTGTFEGGGHTITGLTINYNSTNDVGMIGYLGSGGKVQNLTLENVNITGKYYVGGVVGWNEGTVTNCSASGNVYGDEDVGGVVGANENGTMTACYFTGDVSGSNQVGGVVGTNGSTMTACYHVSGTISGSGSYVGGVVGWNLTGTVTACYHASGRVESNYYVGGVAGSNYYYSTITACYWGCDYESSGIGLNNGSGTATKVGGDDCETWKDAQEAMNVALTEADSDWRYENAGDSANADYAPTLTKVEE